MEDRESLYNSAIKPAIIFIVLYVTVKQAVYMTFFDRVYWLPRGIAGFGLLFATLFLTGRQFSRRQMSWLIPVAMILAELIVIPFVEYDRLVYFYLIGCALMSLLFVDVFGLFITIAVSWVSVAIYIFVFNYSLMGQDCFADDLFYFIGVMVAQVMIFLMGRYSVSALDKSRRELEIAYRQTEELAKMKSELFTAMSHEMRTPLTVMSAYAQYAVEQIREVGANDQTFADLGVISDEARRLAEMADGTLNVLMG
ncbi:MAG: hypothetical protein LBC70_05855, partial [Chitinispirillales bacterium]|nr:hypothetical protein [Chitinispirillales bacterium]